jgi:hypothetical protein
MNKNIAIALVAVAAIVAFFLAGAVKSTKSFGSGNFSLPFTFSGAKLPNLENAFTVTSAWSVFQDYLKAAKDNDLEKLKSHSYQTSETCNDPKRRAECNELMTGVYLIASGFKLEDFKNVESDAKQIIMSTDYMKMPDGADDTKVVLYFVKAETGEPKVLGIRFCYGLEDGLKCVITDPETRDVDHDGWWDDIEALFYEEA